MLLFFYFWKANNKVITYRLNELYKGDENELCHSEPCFHYDLSFRCLKAPVLLLRKGAVSQEEELQSAIKQQLGLKDSRYIYKIVKKSLVMTVQVLYTKYAWYCVIKKQHSHLLLTAVTYFDKDELFLSKKKKKSCIRTPITAEPSLISQAEYDTIFFLLFFRNDCDVWLFYIYKHNVKKKKIERRRG